MNKWTGKRSFLRDKFPVISYTFEMREVRRKDPYFGKGKRRFFVCSLTFIERPGQEDCRQNQEDHVPREPVPHPREVPSPPGRENIRLILQIATNDIPYARPLPVKVRRVRMYIGKRETLFARGELPLSCTEKSAASVNNTEKLDGENKIFMSLLMCIWKHTRISCSVV